MTGTTAANLLWIWLIGAPLVLGIVELVRHRADVRRHPPARSL